MGRKSRFSFVLSALLVFSLSFSTMGMDSSVYNLYADEEEESAVHFSTGKGRVIRINCPVDVSIYSEDGTLLGQIIKEKKIASDSLLPYGINEDGEKMVFLPSDGHYKLDIIAREDALVNVNIVEDLAYDGVARLINYYDIAMVKDGVLKLDVPAYSKEDIEKSGLLPSSVKYTVYDEKNKKEIEENMERSGEEANTSEVYIDAQSENLEEGFVFGKGHRVLGSFAKLRAFPVKNYDFEGWYENKQKVSSKPEYRLRADKDRVLIAKFKKKEELKENTEKPNTSGSSSSHSSSGAYRVSDKKDQDIKMDESIKEEVLTEKNDIPLASLNHWAKKYIAYGYKHGIVEGYEDKSFQPDSPATRAEVLKMVIASKHFDKSDYKAKFSDVKSEDWFSGYVQTGIEKKLIKGYSDGMFKPNNTITRAEAIKVLMSLMKCDDLREEEVEETL